MAENPNEYDEDAFVDASTELQDAVVGLWDAGASADDIKSEFENALRNAVDG